MQLAAASIRGQNGIQSNRFKDGRGATSNKAAGQALTPAATGLNPQQPKTVAVLQQPLMVGHWHRFNFKRTKAVGSHGISK
jgi:hypothetical protein